MASEKERFLKAMHRQECLAGELDFEYLLRTLVPRAAIAAGIDVDPYIMANSTRLWNALLDDMDADLRLGRKPSFYVRDRYAKRLSYYAHELSINGKKEERGLAARLKARPSLLQATDSLSNRDYEALGAVCCELIGATRVHITRPGNDAGIDFFALLDAPSKCHVFGGANRPIRVVGQSKRYISRVEVGQMREFSQTFTSLREQNSPMEKLVPHWFRSADGPLVGWLIAHSGAQSGALDHAKNHGIMVSDSRDVAELAALSRKLDCSLSCSDRASHLCDLVRAKLGAK